MHILSPETDICLSWLNGRERMTEENISRSISKKRMLPTRQGSGSNLQTPDHQSDAHKIYMLWITAPPRLELCITHGKTSLIHAAPVFVCVEVLRPSQSNGVMSSTVSLPNHTLTGQAKSAKRLTSIVHILSPETDNCLSWLNERERTTVENISRSISKKRMLPTRQGSGSNLQTPDHQLDTHKIFMLWITAPLLSRAMHNTWKNLSHSCSTSCTQ